MKLSINQSEFLNALVIVQKGITSRSTLPVLSGVFVQARGDEVTFQTTDLELSIQYTTTALVEEEGETVLPGKLIVDIVKNLPDAAVHVESTDDSAIVSCESSSFSIRCLNPADFPRFSPNSRYRCRSRCSPPWRGRCAASCRATRAA